MHVNDRPLEVKRTLINVSDRVLVSPIFGPNQVPSLINSTMMDVDFPPEHLVVTGGSYVGLGFDQMFCRFGLCVMTVEESSRLIAREDEDVLQAVRETLEAKGTDVQVNADCLSVRHGGTNVVVGLECDSGVCEVSGSHLLMAVGRTPNTDGLGLDKAGAEVDKCGNIRVDEQLYISVPGTWALGDRNDRGVLTYMAHNDYEVVTANLLDGDPCKVPDHIQAYAIYVDPPLACASTSLSEAKQSGHTLLVDDRPMAHTGRAVEKGESQDFVYVVVDARMHEVLSASVLDVGGDEAVHPLLDVVYVKAPYITTNRAMYVHSTVSRLIPTLLQDIEPVQ